MRGNQHQEKEKAMFCNVNLKTNIPLCKNYWRFYENSWSSFDRSVYLFPSTFCFYIDNDVLTNVLLDNNFQEYFCVHKYTWGAKCYLSKHNLCKSATVYCRQNCQGIELSIMVLNCFLIFKSIYSLYGDICWGTKDTFLLMEHSTQSGSLDFPIPLKKMKFSCTRRNIQPF